MRNMGCAVSQPFQGGVLGWKDPETKEKDGKGSVS